MKLIVLIALLLSLFAKAQEPAYILGNSKNAVKVLGRFYAGDSATYLPLRLPNWSPLRAGAVTFSTDSGHHPFFWNTGGWVPFIDSTNLPDYSDGVDVRWFGARADSSTICDDAIAAAFDSAQAWGINRVNFPAGKAYIITNTVKFPANIGVIMDPHTPIMYRGDMNRPAVIVGDSSVRTRNQNYQLAVTSEAMSDWTNDTCVGLLLVNLSQCNSISIADASRFTVGVRCVGVNNQGFVYNNIYFGNLIDNKIGVDLRRGGSGGWVNENNFYGGRFTVSSGHSGLDRYGIKISAEDGGTSNNNNFYKPSIELGANLASPGEALPILIEAGVYNKFMDVRSEGNSTASNDVAIRTTGGSSNNAVEIGYMGDLSASYDDEGSFPSTSITTRQFNILNSTYDPFYISGNLANRITPYSSTTVYFPDELNAFVSTTSSTPLNNTTNVVNEGSYISMTGIRAVGVRVSTNTCKRFVIKRSYVNTFYGHVVVICYDSLGNILTGTSPAYAVGHSSSGLTYTTSFGGSYTTSSSNDRNIYINLRDTVYSMDVLLNGGTDSLKLKGFSIQAIGGKASIINLKTKRGTFATQAPTTGTWEVGTLFRNPAPTTASWAFMCSVAGTPGTWVTIPTPVDLTNITGGAQPRTLPNNSGNNFTPTVVNQMPSNVAGIEVGVGDGTRNRRMGMYVDDSSASPSYGLTSTYSSDTKPFNIRDPFHRFITILQNGRIGLFDLTAPTSWLDLPASLNGTASMRFTPGVATATGSLSDGQLYYDDTHLMMRIGSSTVQLDNNKNIISGTATLDFPSTSAQSSSDLTIAVTGAASGDMVSLGVPNGSTLTNSSFSAWVSSSGVVTVRFNNYSAGVQDPPSGSFTAGTIK